MKRPQVFGLPPDVRDVREIEARYNLRKNKRLR
jgi:hypothetical protein